MKRLTAAILALTLAGALAGCGGGKPPEPTIPDPGPSGEVTVAEQVLVDQAGVVITLLSMGTRSSGDPVLSIQIKNGSPQDIQVSVENAAVNGATIKMLLFSTVAAGEQVDDGIVISLEALEGSGITTIAEMDIEFRAWVAGTIEEVFATGYVNVKTSAFGTFVQAFDSSGPVVYEGAEMRFVYQGLGTDIVGRQVLTFYVENNSSTRKWITAMEVSVNGVAIDDAHLYSEIRPGNVSYAKLSIEPDAMDANGLTSVDTITLSFLIYESDYEAPKVDSGPIEVF
jgi:hypothetical protein